MACPENVRLHAQRLRLVKKSSMNLPAKLAGVSGRGTGTEVAENRQITGTERKAMSTK